jgi:hypothetical protein
MGGSRYGFGEQLIIPVQVLEEVIDLVLWQELIYCYPF